MLEIGQQPVRLHRPESANVVEMPDFIGCFQFFRFLIQIGQTDLKLHGKVYCAVLHLGEGPGADCAAFSGRQWSLVGSRWIFWPCRAENRHVASSKLVFSPETNYVCRHWLPAWHSRERGVGCGGVGGGRHPIRSSGYFGMDASFT